MAAQSPDDDAFSPSAPDLIAPETRRRQRPALFPAGDVIDAEFEEITAAASVRPAVLFDNPRSPNASGTVRRRVRGVAKSVTISVPVAVEPPARRLPFGVAVVALGALSFWACGGRTLAARLLPSAPRTLAIADLTTRIGRVNGIPVAVVNGRVHNGTAERKAVPPIEITIGTARRVTVAAAAEVLDPGGTAGFRARVPVASEPAPAISAAFADIE